MLITIVPIDKHTCMHTWTCAYMHIQLHVLQMVESVQPYKHGGQQYAFWMKLKHTPRRKAVANMQ